MAPGVLFLMEVLMFEEQGDDLAVKFLPYPLLLKAAATARKRNYNRQVTDEFVNKTVPEADPDHDFNYPIVKSFPHEHAQGKPVNMHMRCEILGPWGPSEQPILSVLLDIDMDLFTKLPDTSIYDEETGHLPSA
jgi:hypothetical protein|tara:strand:+ start:603 stop:1004 length:402 start_codon:yes stop_codon:yes gene_type:complete